MQTHMEPQKEASELKRIEDIDIAKKILSESGAKFILVMDDGADTSITWSGSQTIANTLGLLDFCRLKIEDDARKSWSLQ